LGIIEKLLTLLRRPPQAVVHDSTASKPRDLDETFFDEKAQERVGKAISNSNRSERI